CETWDAQEDARRGILIPARPRSTSSCAMSRGPGLLGLRLYYFASFAALGAYVPFFPRWLEARGIVGLRMGLVAGLLPAMGILGPPAVGLLADALGLRGSLLRIACLGACASMAALAALSGAGHLVFGAVFAAVLAY